MALVLISCAHSGDPVSTGIELDPEEFDASELVEVLSCPSCGRTHFWEKPDAFLAS